MKDFMYICENVIKNEIENDGPKKFTPLQKIACKNSVTCSSCENFYVVNFKFYCPLD